MPFFVVGLPRSRTAWLAVALTTDHSYCKHEGLLDGASALVPWLSEPRRGDSDSGLTLLWNFVYKYYEGAPVVVVKRDPMQVRQSLTNFLGDRVDPARLLGTLTDMETGLKEIELTVPHLSVRFEDVGNPETGEAIWSHCLPDLPFDSARWAYLNGFNIQQDLSKYG